MDAKDNLDYWARISGFVKDIWQKKGFQHYCLFCEKKPLVIGGFPSQRTNDAEHWWFCCNYALHKQPSCRWFETLMWRHCNVKSRNHFIRTETILFHEHVIQSPIWKNTLGYDILTLSLLIPCPRSVVMRWARQTLLMASPCPVHDTPPAALSQ